MTHEQHHKSSSASFYRCVLKTDNHHATHTYKEMMDPTTVQISSIPPITLFGYTVAVVMFSFLAD